jgi:hypothetical protein
MPLPLGVGHAAIYAKPRRSGIRSPLVIDASDPLPEVGAHRIRAGRGLCTLPAGTGAALYGGSF